MVKEMANNITDNEIIGVLQRSKKINLIVEGVDESSIFRKVEDIVGDVELIICEGCGTLKRVYSRKDEYPKAKVIFLADRDIRLFDPTARFEADIIWTDGYSIENDIVCGSRVFELLDFEERGKYRIAFQKLIKWFDSEVEKYLRHQDFKIDLHPNRILDGEEYLPDYKHLESILKLNHIDEATGISKMRGKNLVQLLLKYLTAPNRMAKYSRLAIIEIAMLDRNTPFNSNLRAKLVEAKVALTQ